MRSLVRGRAPPTVFGLALSLACRIDPPTRVEGPVVEHELTDELRRWSDRQLGSAGHVDAHPAACSETCKMATRLCRVRSTACELSRAHFDEDGFEGLCDAATQACRDTQATCQACTCAPR